MAVAATVDLAPGERRSDPLRARVGPARSSSSGPVAAGGSATRATGAGPASAPSTWPATPSSRRRRGARRSRHGSSRSSTRTTAPTGTRRPSSTSCTSSSMAGRSGRPARSTARSRIRADPGRFALLECLDYPFYDSVDVDFYASFAILRLFPELEARGIRDLLAAVAVDDPEIVTIEASGLTAPRKVGGTVPHDVGGPDDDPFYRPNRYKYQDVNDWKDLGPKFVLQVWRDAVAAGAERRCPDPRRLADGRGVADPAVGARSGRRRAARARWPPRPDIRHLADARAVGVRRLAVARRTRRRRGDGRAARCDARPRGAGRVGSSAARSPSTGGCGGATITPTTTAAVSSSDSIMADQLAGQWYADATGLRRPPAGATASKPRCGRSTG